MIRPSNLPTFKTLHALKQIGAGLNQPGKKMNQTSSTKIAPKVSLRTIIARTPSFKFPKRSNSLDSPASLTPVLEGELVEAPLSPPIEFIPLPMVPDRCKARPSLALSKRSTDCMSDMSFDSGVGGLQEDRVGGNDVRSLGGSVRRSLTVDKRVQTPDLTDLRRSKSVKTKSSGLVM